jgi:hypothetical protein
LAVIAALIAIVTSQTKADSYNLTGAPSGLDQAQINGAWFYNVNYSSTGSGVIDSFLRIGSNDPTEQGYNTDYRSNKAPKYPEFDEDKEAKYNHSLLLSSVPNVDLFQNGTFYREFLLDINQNKSGEGRLLSLDKLEIYMGDSNDLYNYSTGFNGLGTKIYDLGSGTQGANWILMDYSLNHGSGSGDLYAYIPNSLFIGGTYVYLYSMFGVHNPNTASFEEWAVRESSTPPPPPPPPVPAPAAILLGMLGLSISGIKLRKFA